MQDRIIFLLPQILTDRNLHARWLNTLSFLEYIGFRKIVKSQIAGQLDFETLGHALEEVRHAHVLKKHAIKLGGENFETYCQKSLLCGPKAETYFQSLDRACDKHIATVTAEKKNRLTYLYVTWLVEHRALSVYEFYQSALASAQMPGFLKGILVEERHHLRAVERELVFHDTYFTQRVFELKSIEQSLYDDFTSAILQEILGMEHARAAGV